jgi:prepilin-type N-terminal cleavage/methylation domain-containing protein
MRRGFSLIELMIVLAILAVVLGISATMLRGENRDAAVKGAAEELAAVLRLARNRAMHEKAAFAVVFNIQNAPGSSGATLNNWSGGHWYRTVGPSTFGHAENYYGNGASSRSIPLPGAYRSTTNGWDNANFPTFIEHLRTAWIDEPHPLPAKKVRFLALGDTDEGPRNSRPAGDSRVGAQRYYGFGGEDTYPRPWFGYYDTAGRRLHAWGGYDPARNHSAFYYEGRDGDVSGSRNASDRLYDNDFNRNGVFANIDLNGDGDVDDPREREVAYPIWRRGEPRPLVNAEWMDSAIMFVPSGEAIYLEWNRGRGAYQAVQGSDNANGVQDCAKTGKVPRDYYGQFAFSSDTMAEVAHFERHTGGWHITLAPDADRDGNAYPDARSALNSILPAYRVHVGRSGTVRVLRVQRRGDGYLDGHAVWPPSPAQWNVTASGNPIWTRCRLGYLHAPESTDSYALRPVGRPITGIVTERMLTERIWWFDE